MIFLLPLICSDGRPAALTDLSKDDLMQYLRLLLKYDVEYKSKFTSKATQLIHHSNPSWWNSELPLSRTENEYEFTASSNNNEISNEVLMELITAAYQYYSSGILIGLSAQLAKPTGGIFGDIRVQDLRNGYAEVVRGHGEVLLTCRSTNKSDGEEIMKGKTTVRNNFLDCKLVNQKEDLKGLKLNQKRSANENCVQLRHIKKQSHKFVYNGSVTKKIPSGPNTMDNSSPTEPRFNSVPKILSSQPTVCLKRFDASRVQDFSKSLKVPTAVISPTNIMPLIRGRRASEESIYSNSTDSGYAPSLSANDHVDVELEENEDHAQEESSKKYAFLAGLGLVRATGVRNRTKSIDFLLSNATKPRRSMRLRFQSHIKKHPIPLTSGLGQQLAYQHSHLNAKERELKVVKYGTFCKTKKTSSRKRTSSRVKIQTNVKSIANDDCHVYCFTKKERLDRNSEIVIGVNQSAFHALNNCKTLTVALERITDADIAEANASAKPPKPNQRNVDFLNNPDVYVPDVVLEYQD